MSVTEFGLDSDQVLLGTARGPGLWLADITTEPPQSLEAPWDGWDPLGYASEDGPTVASATDSTDIRGWQSLGVLRSVITGRTITVAFQLLQWNAVNMALYFDIDRPTIDPDGSFRFSVRSDQAGRRHSLGVDIRDGENEVRIVFPRVQLQAAGDMNFQRGALAMLDVTFAALETEGVLLGVMGKVASAATPEGRAQGYQWWPIAKELPAAERTAPSVTSSGGGD